ncbi:LysR family transcriptional regulator [Anaerostipes hadrus]|jgi:LysR family transcriptional activator of glutamate synthase operon|uniref:LysR family transcriptional regulator n=1 Tax=Anaerostipes hadrus TaxID=649756 RepID=UPI0022E410FA|nr:LysR family transcriptional regulator [Anaerostipes hadrus]
MEIQQLYYYMELCKQKNFTEAGYACNMTQGALSKQIRKLENELGITLIRRNTRKFELSKEGEIFLSYAKKMTGTYEEMLKNVQKNQEIKIGCMPVLAPYHFARLVADFRKEYPDIKLVIDERIASEIQENSDRYDFLILRENMMEDQKNFRFSQLYDDKLCAVLYEKHPLYGRDRLQLKELKDDVFIFPERGSGSYEVFYKSCEKAGFEPKIAFEFPQANTIMSFVSEGVGVTITFSTVYREAKCAGVKMIPLEDELHSVISLFYRKNKPLDYAKKQFLNYVREHLYT